VTSGSRTCGRCQRQAAQATSLGWCRAAHSVAVRGPSGRRPRRLLSAVAGDRLGRSVAGLLPRRPHALRDPVEGRGAARLGRPGRRPRLQGADAPRPVAGGSALRHPAAARRAARPRWPPHPQGLARLLLIPSVHLTAETFDHPEQFDPDRFLGPDPPPTRPGCPSAADGAAASAPGSRCSSSTSSSLPSSSDATSAPPKQTKNDSDSAASRSAPPKAQRSSSVRETAPAKRSARPTPTCAGSRSACGFPSR